MSLRPTYRFALGLFALLIISLQSGAIAHAAQFGDDPHEHNGVLCVLDAVAPDAAAELPAVIAVPAPVSVPVRVYSVTSDKIVCITPQGRAPPPRSPPTISF